MTPRTSSAAWVRGITDMLTAQGLPAADLCTQAGIDLQALQQPHTRVDVDRVSHLWELAVARHPPRHTQWVVDGDGDRKSVV